MSETTKRLNRRSVCISCAMDRMVFAMLINSLAGSTTKAQRARIRKLLDGVLKTARQESVGSRERRVLEDQRRGAEHPKRLPGRAKAVTS